MSKSGGIIGIIAGIFGFIAAIVTLFAGGLGSAFEAEGADTVVSLGWGGFLFSCLVIVLGALAIARMKGAGIGLIIVSILGIIFGGTLVAICMILSLIGGILVVAGAKSVQSASSSEAEASKSTAIAPKKGVRVWLRVGLGTSAIVLILVMFMGQTISEPKEDALIELANALPSTLSAEGEISDLFALGSKNTNLQRDNKIKEIKGQIVQWQLPVYEVSRSGDNYKVQTQTGLRVGHFGQDLVGTFVYITPRNNAERRAIEALKTGDPILFKGRISGSSLRSLEIKPAILILQSMTTPTASDAPMVAKPIAPQPKSSVNVVESVVDDDLHLHKTLCQPDKVIFSCMTKNSKHVDVCDSGDKISYFYGKSSSQLEMSLFIPRSTASTRPWNGMGRSMTYAVNIPNGNTTYSLYWSAVRDPDEPDPISAGIEVIVSGISRAVIECIPETVEQNIEDIDLQPEPQ